MMQCFAIAAAATLLWLIIGYSLSFGDDLGGVLGGAGKVFFDGVTADAAQGTIPEIVFAIFQMTFAIITPALIVGAYVERIKFPAVLLISAAWVLLVYSPICHWVWGSGWLQEMGVMDFAGGLVVHLSAGVSALVIAAMLGRRQGFPGQLQPPHNPGMTAAGAALLWVGWFGFNGGSQLAADGGAGMAIAATHIAAAAGAASWSAVEWLKFGRPSLVGAATGVIAGLATVTPASGFVGPAGGLILGAVAGVVCFFRSGRREGTAENRRLSRCFCRPRHRRRHRGAAGVLLGGNGSPRRRSCGGEWLYAGAVGRAGPGAGGGCRLGRRLHLHHRQGLFGDNRRHQG